MVKSVKTHKSKGVVKLKGNANKLSKERKQQETKHNNIKNKATISISVTPQVKRTLNNLMTSQWCIFRNVLYHRLTNSRDETQNCIKVLVIFDSANGLSPVRRQSKPHSSPHPHWHNRLHLRRLVVVPVTSHSITIEPGTRPLMNQATLLPWHCSDPLIITVDLITFRSPAIAHMILMNPLSLTYSIVKGAVSYRCL